MSEQSLFPMLAYSDAAAAIEFLCDAFGFVEKLRYVADDGRIGHAELECEGSVVMLADDYPEFGLSSPCRASSFHSQLLLVVSDVVSHYERAKAAGAVVVGTPSEDHGSIGYRAMDSEGHRWLFSQRSTDPS
jgi:uncharacterized glyoxalase superfamily protein PhnB